MHFKMAGLMLTDFETGVALLCCQNMLKFLRNRGSRITQVSYGMQGLYKQGRSFLPHIVALRSS